MRISALLPTDTVFLAAMCSQCTCASEGFATYFACMQWGQLGGGGVFVVDLHIGPPQLVQHQLEEGLDLPPLDRRPLRAQLDALDQRMLGIGFALFQRIVGGLSVLCKGVALGSNPH